MCGRLGLDSDEATLRGARAPHASAGPRGRVDFRHFTFPGDIDGEVDGEADVIILVNWIHRQSTDLLVDALGLLPPHEAA